MKRQATMMNPATASKPPHIAEDLVRDIDIFALPGSDKDIQKPWKEIQDSGPAIFWTPRNGGHWVAARERDIVEMQRNWALFSSRSVTIPANQEPNLPLEVDPPYHTELRRLISPLFVPGVLRKVEDQARSLAVSLIEGFRDKGRIDFVREFAEALPITIFLWLMDLPDDDLEMMMGWAEATVRSPHEEERLRAKTETLNYLQNVVEERRKNLGEDFISTVIKGKVGGRDINEDEILNTLLILLFGGLDTVITMMSCFMAHLAEHPGQRNALEQDPGLIPAAVNELIRRHGIVNICRVAAKDMEYNGVQFKEGDKILLPNCLAGLDEEKFPNAMTVDFNRPNAAQHAAFGNGPHRCPGANIARMELRVMLEEWLPRIPDFRIDGDVKCVAGITSGVVSLPLAWDT